MTALAGSPRFHPQVGNAFLTLFVTATLDGYTPTMYATMASQ